MVFWKLWRTVIIVYRSELVPWILWEPWLWTLRGPDNYPCFSMFLLSAWHGSEPVLGGSPFFYETRWFWFFPTFERINLILWNIYILIYENQSGYHIKKIIKLVLKRGGSHKYDNSWFLYLVFTVWISILYSLKKSQLKKFEKLKKLVFMCLVVTSQCFSAPPQ